MKTKLISNKSDWTTVLPGEVVEGSLKNLGRKKVCSGSIKHELLSEVIPYFPRHIESKIEESYSRWVRLQELKRRRKK